MSTISDESEEGPAQGVVVSAKQSMTHYTNHVILKGLDEARAHQRGEAVGKPKLAIDHTMRRTAKTKAERRIIATAEGTQMEVAERLGVSQCMVSKCRQLLRDGLLDDDPAA